MFHALLIILELAFFATLITLTAIVLHTAITEKHGDPRMIVVNTHKRRCTDCHYGIYGPPERIDVIFADHRCEMFGDVACCEPDYDYGYGGYSHAESCTRFEDA